MKTKKNLIILAVLFFVLNLFPAPQLRDNPFGGSAEPEISAAIEYEKGLVLFQFSMDPDHHITDVKNGFFKIEVEKNDFIEIGDTVFPAGVPYADEKVFKGDFTVKAYIKSLKEITEPVELKFKATYQVCQEKPLEMCFPPASEELKLKIDKSFTKYVLEAAPATASTTTKTAAREIPGAKINRWFLLLAGVLLLAAAIFAGLFKPAEEGEIKAKFLKALLALIFIGGAFLYIQSLDMRPAAQNLRQKPQNPVKVTWIKSIETGRAAAQKENKPMMVDTYADWCVACKELEEYTFSAPEVAAVLENYVLVKVDFTKETEANDKLRRELKVFGMPTVIFFDAAGKETRRFSGFYDKKKFLEFIGSGSSFFEKLLAPLNRELEKKSLLLFLMVFGLGFLTSLTPCVYPVIPIVMGYVGARSGSKKLKGLFLSIFFVLGLAFVYSILGVIAGATGTMMGATFQNPIVVIVIAAIFVIMGLSLAGLFEIPVPTSISSKMQAGHKSDIIGSLIIGGVAGVIAAPCVGPVLIALLSWISQTKDIVFGFLLTFTFSLGMGVIFLVVGTFTGIITALPKGGKWMDYVKYFFAAVLIAGGIFILNPITAGWLAMLLWGIFLVALSVFAGVLKPLAESAVKSKIFKLAIVIVFLSGVFLFFKALDTRYFSPREAVVVETGWLAPAAK